MSSIPLVRSNFDGLIPVKMSFGLCEMGCAPALTPVFTQHWLLQLPSVLGCSPQKYHQAVNKPKEGVLWCVGMPVSYVWVPGLSVSTTFIPSFHRDRCWQHGDGSSNWVLELSSQSSNFSQVLHQVWGTFEQQKGSYLKCLTVFVSWYITKQTFFFRKLMSQMFSFG